MIYISITFCCIRNCIDYIYYSAISFSISDVYRCENKFKNCLKIMRLQKLDYKSFIISSIDKNDNNPKNFWI